MPSTSEIESPTLPFAPSVSPLQPIQRPSRLSRAGRRALTNPPTGRSRRSSVVEGVDTEGALLETTTNRPSSPITARPARLVSDLR